MLIESAIANIYDSALETSEPIDWLDLTWLECRNRSGRKSTRSGREVLILLRLNHRLRNGDVLGQWPDGSSIVVNLLPANVLVASPENQSQGLLLAFELGNQHVPVEIAGNQLLTPVQASIQAMLERLSVPFETQNRVFQPDLWPQSVRLAQDFRVTRR